MRSVGWLEEQLVKVFKPSPRRGKRRFLGDETRSWEVADVRLDQATEHLERTLALLELAYGTHWEYLGEQPEGPDESELIDVYEHSLDPLPSWEHERLVIGDSVKEAVSIAEVYLDDLARHVRPYLGEGAQDKALVDGLDRHSYPRLIAGYQETFEIDLRAKPYWPQWCEIRATRHLLTHNWGRYNRRYFEDAVRPPDIYQPRLDVEGPPRLAQEATTTIEQIPLEKEYALTALGVARRIVDEVETELGAEVRKHGIDWYS